MLHSAADLSQRPRRGRALGPQGEARSSETRSQVSLWCSRPLPPHAQCREGGSRSANRAGRLPGSPVSCVTAVAASASVAKVTMSSEATVTMLTSSPSSGSRILMPALPWCTVFTWERRLSTRLKPRPHLSQRNGFSPARNQAPAWVNSAGKRYRRGERRRLRGRARGSVTACWMDAQVVSRAQNNQDPKHGCGTGLPGSPSPPSPNPACAWL